MRRLARQRQLLYPFARAASDRFDPVYIVVFSWQGLPLTGRVTHGLDVVAIRAEHEGASEKNFLAAS